MVALEAFVAGGSFPAGRMRFATVEGSDRRDDKTAPRAEKNVATRPTGAVL